MSCKSSVILRLAICLTAVLMLVLAPLPGVAAERADCSGATYRAFDFWLGAWRVQLEDGRLAGSNLITASEDGCFIEERWTGAGGGQGFSLNYYDPHDAAWHQRWVSRDALIDISGNFSGQGMVLEGTITDRLSSERAPFRGRWTQLPDGRVRQYFEQLSGDTWEPWFEGFYSKVVE